MVFSVVVALVRSALLGVALSGYIYKFLVIEHPLSGFFVVFGLFCVVGESGGLLCLLFYFTLRLLESLFVLF